MKELIARDPPLGLAKLRIDLEREVRQMYLRRVSDARRQISLTPMVRELVQHDVLPQEWAGPLQEVTALTNRAVHGEYVLRDKAEEIADVGERLLYALQLLNEGTAPESPDAGEVLPSAEP